MCYVSLLQLPTRLQSKYAHGFMLGLIYGTVSLGGFAEQPYIKSVRRLSYGAFQSNVIHVQFKGLSSIPPLSLK